METESHPIAGVDYPRTFQEMEQWFRDEAACRDYIRRLRWPEGFICPHCGVSGEPWLMSDELLRCCSCRARTSFTAGTIFEGTRKPLRTWFMAMWFVTSQKNGVSALGLQRVLGLGSYETAWTWLHKLRRAMVRPGRERLSGTVEVDAPSGEHRLVAAPHMIEFATCFDGAMRVGMCPQRQIWTQETRRGGTSAGRRR